MSHNLIITVYTTPSCPACAATKRHLDRLGIPYLEIPIDSDPNIIEAIGELELSTAPVVCASTGGKEQVWSGYRPDRIDALKCHESPLQPQHYCADCGTYNPEEEKRSAAHQDT